MRSVEVMRLIGVGGPEAVVVKPIQPDDYGAFTVEMITILHKAAECNILLIGALILVVLNHSPGPIYQEFGDMQRLGF